MTDLVVERNGNVRLIYDETINLHCLGDPIVRRASYVEPVERGGWIADLSLMNGPILGPFKMRGEAIEKEVRWLRSYWLLVEGDNHAIG